MAAPVVLLDQPEADYHADPALSSSGARSLTRMPPARWRWEQQHARKPKKAYDIGHAVHTQVLGIGAGAVVPCDPDGQPYARWDSTAAKDEVQRIRDAGGVPLKADEAAAAQAMAEAVLTHDVAGRIFTSGRPEVSIYFDDPDTGVRRRVRTDWLTEVGGRLLIADLKTIDDASPAAFAKSVATYGYHCQDAYYRDGIVAAGLHPDPFFWFVVVEKQPPHLVAVYELDDDALTRGWAANRAAIDLYAKCLANDDWPGYAPGVQPLALPRWA